MSIARNVAFGIQILDKYTGKDAYHVRAEHDCIWAGPDLDCSDWPEDFYDLDEEEQKQHVLNIKNIPQEDLLELLRLGWHVDTECERFTVYV